MISRKNEIKNPAASEWIPLKKATIPTCGRSYLIRREMVEPVHDIAFYNGLKKDGSHWWTLGNIEIDSENITHYAHIIDIDEIDNND